MVTTALDYWESDYAVGRRHTDFTGRNSTPDVGAMNDRDAQMYWRVIRGGFIIHREHKILDFQWLGSNADQVKAMAVDRAGNKGAWETYTYSVTANEDADWVAYVDTGGNDTTGDGSEGLPWATVTKAVTEAQSALTSEQVGAIILSDDQSWAHTEPLFTGSDSISCLLRFVRKGGGANAPELTFSTGITAFTAGKRGAFHIDGVNVRSVKHASNGTAINLARSGGVAADRSPWDVMVVDSEISGFYRLHYFDNGLTAADRNDASNEFVAFQNVEFSDSNSYYVFGYYAERHLYAGCTFVLHTGSATNEFTRTYGSGRTFVRDCEFDASAGSGSVRFGAYEAVSSSDDYAIRFVTMARCVVKGPLRFGPNSGISNVCIVRDVRIIDTWWPTGSLTITSNQGATNGANVDRFDVLECWVVGAPVLTVDVSSVSHTISSVRLRNCAVSRSSGSGQVLLLNGAAAKYADDCVEIHGCWARFGAGVSGAIVLINANGMTAAELAAKVGASDYNHVGKADATTPNFVFVSDSPTSRTLAQWQVLSGFDTHSSVTTNTDMNVVDIGVPTAADADFRLASDSGPLAGTGYPLPLGVAIDADGYLRSATTPDAGPYEYGATDTPEDPELPAPSTGVQVNTSLSVGITLGL